MSDKESLGLKVRQTTGGSFHATYTIDHPMYGILIFHGNGRTEEKAKDDCVRYYRRARDPLT